MVTDRLTLGEIDKAINMMINGTNICKINFSSMSLPVRYMVATTSSNEILRLAYRKRDRLTELMARMAATALRSMQGICTRPFTGSQVRPRLCSMAISAAYSICSMFRP